MEITILSAQGLKKPSLFSNHLKPFIILTTTPPSDADVQWWTQKFFSCGTKVRGDQDFHVAIPDHVYTTRVDHVGGDNPTWHDEFDLSNVVDATFFQRKDSCIYLHLYTNRFLLGPRFLGWCGIPASDIDDGLWPKGNVRRLTYKLKKKDGSSGHGVVNVEVKLESEIFKVDSDRN